MNNFMKSSVLAISVVVALIGIIYAVSIVGPSAMKNSFAVVPATSQAAAAAGAFLPADNFVLLANTYTDTTAGTTLTGDLGYTTPPVTPPTVNGGTTHVADATYNTAGTHQASLLSSLNAEPCDFNIGSPTDLSLMSQPLAPGVYCITAATSIGTGGITLSGNGTYLFRIAGAFTTVNGSIVTLTGGASACDVFWTPSAATTLGANSTFKGTVIDAGAITVGANANWVGRALGFGGVVTTDTDTISAPSCSAPGTLHVIKLVINANNGKSGPSDFNLYVKTGGVNVGGSPKLGTSTPGSSYTLSSGTYVVSEDKNTGYTQTFSGDCDSTGSVTMTALSNKICTVINTDLVPLFFGNNGSSGGTASAAVVPLIGLLKVPTPLALPTGAGPVTYNYTVWNVGGLVALADVTLTDDKCSAPKLISGDLNNDGKLDIAEKWNYSCAMTLSTTTTNTAVATGYSDDANHQIAIATAIATVVVGNQTPPPLINIVKVPSRLTAFPAGGGLVTYTYTVTNPGIVAMHDVGVTDDKCGPVTRAAGDQNNNNLLEPSETWIYTCRSNILVSTRNIATARGSANGYTALGYAFASVLVASPTFPNTGFAPQAK